MLLLMDKDISNFTLAEANDARKIIGKKQMERIPELKKKFFESCENRRIEGGDLAASVLPQYIWETAILPQLG